MIHTNILYLIIKWEGQNRPTKLILFSSLLFPLFYIAPSLHNVLTSVRVNANEKMGAMLILRMCAVYSPCSFLFAPVYGLRQTLFLYLLHKIQVSMGLASYQILFYLDSTHVMYIFNNCQLVPNSGIHYNISKLGDQWQVP